MSKNYVKEYKGHKVPEGASCFVEACKAYKNHFGKKVSGVEYVFVVDNENPEWHEISAVLPLDARGAIELPEESIQEWNGQGRLSADMICLMEDNTGPDREVEVLFIGSQIAVVKPVDGLGGEMAVNLTGYVKFKPLKTQEQKDREAFIEWAKAGLHLNIDDMGAAFKVVEQLADNGAKAPEGE